jgi:hypothetical protein
MPDIEQIALAVLGAIGFGWIVAWYFHSSWQRLLVLLIVLWTLQTGPQYLFRWLDGQDVSHEVWTVTLLRVTFTVVAVVSVALFNRRERDR